ncbi:hypothetical protein [Anaerobium acetethylicum]|uniref:Uncharacterized protein n=1 Tax=Anaerobium acetethylicum TaxID=1619234 RepID=A0A1D3TNN8_9FIRM|nr:hypothetical protein [Anaerobium acetethylicum]SCP94930.1 hypothetical protein SAMN05421730_1001168 [Anaerobium acetethylicum]
MPWCPNCKNEYVEGITECADCHVELVEELPLEEKMSTLLFAEEELAKELAEFLAYSNITGVQVAYNEEYAMYEVLAPEKYDREAMKYTNVFKNTKEKMLAESEGAMVAEDTEESPALPEKAKEKPAFAYVKKADRYDEVISSAYTFLLVGVIGLIALFLVATNVIPLNLAGGSKYLIYIVMGAMFVIFLVISVYSFKSAKVLAKEAVEEKELTEAIMDWFIKGFSKEAFEVSADTANDEKISDEVRYFRRCEKIKEIISTTYENLDESYLDKITEDLYQKIFE